MKEFALPPRPLPVKQIALIERWMAQGIVAVCLLAVVSLFAWSRTVALIVLISGLIMIFAAGFARAVVAYRRSELKRKT